MFPVGVVRDIGSVVIREVWGYLSVGSCFSVDFHLEGFVVDDAGDGSGSGWEFSRFLVG